jgi:hypothetical protein
MYKVEESIKHTDYFGDIWIKSIYIDDSIVKIEHFYDKEFGANRYSYKVNYVGGVHISGGYGRNNEIVYPTFDSALDAALLGTFSLDKFREIKLNIILDENSMYIN